MSIIILPQLSFHRTTKVPTTSPETLYVFLWIFVGVTINAYIIGNVANIIANLESEQNDFATKVDEIKRYMFRVSL